MATHLALFIVVMSLVTFATKVFPFLVLAEWKKAPTVRFIGRLLPVMVMPVLVVYSLKTNIQSFHEYCIPEMVAIAVVVLAHLARRNSLLSIGLGTLVFIWLRHY